MFFVFRNSLHIAVSCGKYDIAEWLIKECAVDIQARDFESGWNALHRSLYYGNIQCAILLLKVYFTSCDNRFIDLKIVLLLHENIANYANTFWI